MGWKYTELPHMFRTDKDGLKKLLLDTMERAGGSASRAMELLDVSRFSWYKYVRNLNLEVPMREIAELHGVVQKGPGFKALSESTKKSSAG